MTSTCPDCGSVFPAHRCHVGMTPADALRRDIRAALRRIQAGDEYLTREVLADALWVAVGALDNEADLEAVAVALELIEDER